ncbi:DciA family protein [Streptomyces sp. NPDC002476]|uniref:DciA family protein n=1 Tax=Streptomyces sp. NPDC002476 TaxID=3364648 RepID=UPI0036CF7FAF
MTTESELSGVDLARQALVAAREAAKKNGATTKKPKLRTGTAVRRGGREPLGLGAAISMMMTERGLVAPAAGGTLLNRWETVLASAAPELASHVQAVGFDADTGRLDVVPESPAYGTKLRWIAPKLIAAATTAVPTANVRTLNILRPSPGKTSPTATGTVPQAVPRTPAPAARPEQAQPGHRHPGYLAALAAHHTAGGTRETGLIPRIREAADRQTQALLQRREPEHAFTEVSAQEEILQAQARQRPAQPDGTLEDSIRTALAYKRRGAPVPAAASQLSQA